MTKQKELKKEIEDYLKYGKRQLIKDFFIQLTEEESDLLTKYILQKESIERISGEYDVPLIEVERKINSLLHSFNNWKNLCGL